jgi:hypothetical protein
MIKFKVVDKESRTSVVVAQALKFYTGSKYNKLKPYLLKFEKNTIVKASKDTLGIFLFNRKKDAKAWIKDQKIAAGILAGVDIKIIKVQILERCYTPRTVAKFLLQNSFIHAKKELDNKNYCNPYVNIEAPEGTSCCYKVKVLT